ncbi:MAG: hypothetical protein KY475_11650, partial [Planctomycetes bacterium]|nr:hypothetical protein [Planctomycetota bacterium]
AGRAAAAEAHLAQERQARDAALASLKGLCDQLQMRNAQLETRSAQLEARILELEKPRGLFARMFGKKKKKEKEEAEETPPAEE